MAAAGNDSRVPSGFGGGPPVRGMCAAPRAADSATPPFVCGGPPHTDLQGKRPLLTGPGLTFTAKTCLQLLDNLSSEQLQLEFNQFKSNNAVFAEKCTDKQYRSLTAIKMKDLIRNSLINNLCNDFDSVVQNYDSLSQNFSYIADKVNEYVEIIHEQHTQLRPAAATTTTVPARADETPSDEEDSFCSIVSATGNTPPLPEPVSFLDQEFDFDVSSIRDSIDFNTRVGSRATAYFGEHEYRYGRTIHKPRPYPSLPVFDQIFDVVGKLDPTFTRENFTCLATLYRDGNSTIPRHSDNEWNIVEGSTIYTLSLGETREITYINTDGIHPLQCHKHELKHGTMSTMTAESQKCWEHSIERDPQRTNPRISLTFRHLADKMPENDVVPPIRQPTKTDIAAQILTPTDSNGKQYKRILLLTDSIHQGCPPGKFNRIGPYRCIKKINYRLCDFMNFEPEFKRTDCIILSAGINDLCRYNFTAETLADVVCSHLTRCSKIYPNKVFILNSLLLTGIGWLNKEVERFNQYLNAFCNTHSNVQFFDSHQVLMEANLDKVLAQPDRRMHIDRKKKIPNGVHITLEAQIVVTDQLVNLVGHLHARVKNIYSSRFYHWRNFVRDEFRLCNSLT